MISTRKIIIARSIMKFKFVATEMPSSEIEWLKSFSANIPSRMKPISYVTIHFDFQSAIVVNAQISLG